MHFKDWLIQIGKSPKTADNYSRAVLGAISNWANDAGLCTDSLDNIHSIAELVKIEDGVKAIPIYQERNTIGKNMYSCALKTFIEYRKSEASEELEHDISHILEDVTIPATEKTTYINARVGQGKYRRELIGHWEVCALTGFSDTRLLVASHIKPWKVSTNNERLDSYNGLLLLPNFDKAFDLGFITFSEQGKIIVSSHLEEAGRLGISNDMKLNLEPPHQLYMGYHRDEVFEQYI
jgi:hypothetical protein